MNTKLSALLMSVLCSVPQIPAGACTGITLKSKDGATVVARTIEWAESVMNCMYVVVPRAQELQSLTPSGMDGLKFRAKHGFVGLAEGICGGGHERKGTFRRIILFSELW